MPGKFSVTPTIILLSNDLSLYIHCASHGLNLAVASSCKLQNVENMMEYVRKLRVYSLTKVQVLREEIIEKHLIK